MTKCPLCGENTAQALEPTTRSFQVRCSTCGNYQLTASAERALRQITRGQEESRFKLACWTYEQNLAGVTPLIDAETIDSVEIAPPDVARRVELYLGAAIDTLHGRLQGRFTSVAPILKVASWSQSNEDAAALAQHLVKRGAVEHTQTGSEYRLLTEGHLIYEQMRGQRTAIGQAFVAMWFDAGMTDLYVNGLSKAIEGAGYDAARVDRIHNDAKIDDQIIAEIRRSAFVVADFTGHRGGVYYEAGFAHGLGKRVVFTCKKDAVKDLHFDVRQYATIEWETHAGVIAPLRNRILALFGAGPKGSTGPIISSS